MVPISDGVRVKQIKRHRENFAFKLGCAWTQVTLQGVDVTEQSKGFVQEVIVVMVPAVHGPRAFPGLPRRIFAMSHFGQLCQNLRTWTTVFGKCPVNAVFLNIGKISHGVLSVTTKLAQWFSLLQSNSGWVNGAQAEVLERSNCGLLLLTRALEPW